jgi:hypothetical protein
MRLSLPVKPSHLAPEIVMCGQRVTLNLPDLRTVSETERNLHVTYFGPKAEDAVPQEQQDASSISIDAHPRRGPLRLKGTFHLPSAQPDGAARMDKARSPGRSSNCAVGATGRMTWAEVGFGTGARTDRACSPSALRARGRRQRGRRCAVGAVARARSG